MAQLPDDYQDGINIKNGFHCSECQHSHDITDVFLWSSCQHKYSRGCVVFVIKQQLYNKKLPICIVDNCNKLLLEDAAQLVLPHEVLMEFYQTHNDYQHPQNQTKKLIDDEKNSLPQYHSLKQSNDTDTSSDGIGDIPQQIFGTINADPDDDSSDAEITYDKTEQEPLLKHQQFGASYGINMNVNKPLFDCILCQNKHLNDDKFAWTQCRHLYGRQCAENMIINWLFKRDIPQCIKCKYRLEVFDAMTLLQFDELQIFKEIYALKASLVSFNAEQQQNQVDKVDITSSEKTSAEIVKKKSENIDTAPIASVSDQTEKLPKHKKNETESKQVDYENKEDEFGDNNLMPSVLMLPDNNYQALIPMDDDFIDENGIILNSKKEAQLKHKNLFYCSRCKKLISLLDDNNNGKYTPTKCKHVSCKQCAKKHTKHEMEVLQFIPSCEVCGLTIVDDDLIYIWGQNEAKMLMDALFQEKSLQLPPADPALANLPQQGIAGAENAENAQNEQNAVNDGENVELEQKAVENDEDGIGYCMTESCHKKGLLSQEKHEESRLDCIGCGISWCVRCGVEWHLGQTCKQYENEGIDDIDIIYALQQQEAMQFDNNYDDIMNGYYDKNEEEFQKLYQQQGWKTCPVCNSVVEKDCGCNRIKCAQCSVSFCWCCVQIVDENGNDKHYEIGKCPLNEEVIGNEDANNFAAGHK